MPGSDPPRCESCGAELAAERYALHLRGLDGGRPECPRQDLVEIALRARGEWDAMRARHSRYPPRGWLARLI
jgi:hypothetical protein